MMFKGGIILIFVLNSIQSTFCQSPNTGDPNWWKNAVFYQIYPRSFMDANNDGIGDLAGITQKLDHLVDAGITALWLSPIYKSPGVDAGYDISDYRDIDPIFGNLDDFKKLVVEAKEKGLKVILDFVPNHTSNEHDWFVKSENNVTGYENYYVWKNGDPDTPPNNWISYFHGSAWKYSEKRKQWYLHQFADAQPDLNYREPKLVEEMKDVLRYWLDLGVDGFRVDIISALFEDIEFLDEPRSNNPNAKETEHGYLNHIYTNDQPETYDMVYQWRALLEQYQAEHGGDTRVMMTESYSDYDKVLKYYGNGTHNGAHFPFNFWFITHLNKDSNARDIKFIIDKWLTYMPLENTANWVMGNHDQFRVATRYGSARVDGLNMLAMLLPGVTVTYNGEEIGMENGEVSWEEGKDPQGCNGAQSDWEKNSRDFQRTPYQWDDSVNAGFNVGTRTWLPVASNYKTSNLKNQLVKGLKSHYRIYQEMVKIKKSNTSKYGDMRTLALTSSVLGLTRQLRDNPTYVLLLNVANKEELVDLSYFRDLPLNLTVKVPGITSSRSPGSVISTKLVKLDAYEALLIGKLGKETISWTPPTRAKELDWWQNAVVYQIYPRSFKDSDNDGNGDIKGIIEKLDHLIDAGVTAAWLSPIYKSPGKDNGYDISDFRDINETYGTMDDFKELVSQAKQKGLKIILDFVPNHSSDQHEWFQKSENKEPGYEDYYIWIDGPSDTPPNNWTSYFHGPAWTYSKKRKQWYLHQFSTYQPDLNYRNEKVVQEMKDVLTYWLDIGVDGFRIDIISALFEHPEFPDGPLPHHVYRNDQPETYDMVYQWRKLLDDYQEEHPGDTRIIMTESYSEVDKIMPYYGNETHNGVHFPFNFWFIQHLNKNSDARDIKSIIDKWLTYMPHRFTPDWVLGNHDQPRVVNRYTRGHVDGLAMLTMLLPGVTITYNGEEIGMENGEVSWEEGDDPQGCNGNQEDWEKNSRDFQRTPFQWDSTRNAGFNKGKKPWLPVAKNYEDLNLKRQKVNNLKSHYRIYQKVLQLKKTDTLKYGDLETLALTSNVLGLRRRLEDNPTFVLLFNVGNKTEAANLQYFDNIPEILHVEIPSIDSKREPGTSIDSKQPVVLNPYEALVLIG
ncbi:hypothetical protein ILUMI_25767 [Ignelater luminosus]|uniref:alpha-glucosidase n=1 Tax=Ignelater luminosus TaxID=2038154 RepID=A0A8K0FW50_IGNLU|nr:hypothetical protein ILUMI_25767 [Ignelater luminosus]